MALRKGFKYSKKTPGKVVRKKRATANQKKAARKRKGRHLKAMTRMKMSKTRKKEARTGKTMSGRRINKPRKAIATKGITTSKPTVAIKLRSVARVRSHGRKLS